MAKQIGAVQFTGKFGDVVGARGIGKKILRAKADSIKNPRTDAQCIQRMICATAGVAVGFLKEILDNSVEGKPSGAKTMNFLRGQWMRQLRSSNMLDATNKLQYIPKGVKSFTCNPYLLSVGTLQAPKFTFKQSIFAMVIESMGTPSDVITASQLFPTVALGNQFTIIGVFYNDDSVFNGVNYCRFAFKTDSVPALVTTSGGFALNPAAIDLNKAEGEWDKLVFNADKHILLTDFCDPYDVLAAGLIISNIENKKRSTSYLVTDTEFDPGEWAASLVYSTYAQEATPIDMASPIYLNNSARVTS